MVDSSDEESSREELSSLDEPFAEVDDPLEPEAEEVEAAAVCPPAVKAGSRPAASWM